jgi:NADPH:quinone reductase-like Zn-dependent oxidoreductase
VARDREVLIDIRAAALNRADLMQRAARVSVASRMARVDGA